MSANDARPCKHCGVNAVPVQHRCGAKQAAITKAREGCEMVERPIQVWDEIREEWVKL